MSTALADSQWAFAAHLRDPENVPGPDNIEARRLAIYSSLIYNNVEGFISGGFPVLHSLLDAADWEQLVRAFLVRHRAQTPYFLEISQEFLQFLQQYAGEFSFLPAFSLELAHYEWMELALDVAPGEFPGSVSLAPEQLLDNPVQINPLAWVLAYNYPVHRIRRDYQPLQALEVPIYLLVYRDRQDAVRFLEVNSVTARIIEILRGDEVETARQALQQLVAEMPQTDPAAIVAGGQETLSQLHKLDVLLGDSGP